MTRTLRNVATLLALAITVFGCAPTPGNPARTSQGGSSDAAAPAVTSNRTLSIVLRVEPIGMTEGADDRGTIHKALFATTLGAWDQQGKPYPVLAETLPQLNTDTWKVFPDGRMETTYKLRQGITWHDGTPITAQDIAFTGRSERARVEWGISATNAELLQITDIEALDPQTVVIKWKSPYVEAAAPQLVPVARHLLVDALEQGSPDAYGNLPYWTTSFVGAGPFKLDQWERGAYIEGSANERYVLGRPKISRVRLTWNNDPTVALTRLLSGDAEMSAEGALRFEQATVLREQWSNPDSILLSPTSLRYVQYQARPDYANPRALLDLRARRALTHAIDRGSLAEAMVDDRSMTADTVPPPVVPYFDRVRSAVTKYPYDPRRSEQLLGELGYTKGADGVFSHPTDGRLRLEVRGVSGGQEEHDTTIVSGQLKENGIDTSIMLLPSSARQVDDKTKGTFPGLTLNNNTISRRDFGLDKFITSRIGGPHDNWVGGNRMGWSNPEFDRLFDAWTTSLDPNQRVDNFTKMMQLLADELPATPLYYNFQVVAHTPSLRGPQRISPETTLYGNVHEWTWTR
jgi:peptide/nickel transport system substrate-binding protein